MDGNHSGKAQGNEADDANRKQKRMQGTPICCLDRAHGRQVHTLERAGVAGLQSPASRVVEGC